MSPTPKSNLSIEEGDPFKIKTQDRQRPRLKGLISEARHAAPPQPWARPPTATRRRAISPLGLIHPRRRDLPKVLISPVPPQGAAISPNVGLIGTYHSSPGTYRPAARWCAMPPKPKSNLSIAEGDLQNARRPNFRTQGRQRPRLKGFISEAKRVAPPQPSPRRLDVVR